MIWLAILLSTCSYSENIKDQIDIDIDNDVDDSALFYNDLAIEMINSHDSEYSIDSAIFMLNKAVYHDRNYEVAYSNLLTCYYLKDDYISVKETCLKFLKLNPQSYSFNYEMALVCYCLNQLNESDTYLNLIYESFNVKNIESLDRQELEMKIVVTNLLDKEDLTESIRFYEKQFGSLDANMKFIFKDAKILDFVKC